jgi:hypothetical protein
MTHYEQSLEWATEWLRTKGSYLEIEDEEQNTWGDDWSDYCLYRGDFETVRFQKESVEISNIVIFDFIVPATKEEFFQVLSILDKP